jgi:FkbH-like protein
MRLHHKMKNKPSAHNLLNNTPIMEIKKEKSEIMTTLFRDSGLSDQGVFEDPPANAVRQGLQKQTIAISATFTAEPVGETLAYWMQNLALPSTITFAPYNQLFQQLLDPTSLLSQNQRGINVILLRFEDWLRFDTDAEQGEIPEEKIENHVHELIQALQVAARRSATPHLVCVCPTSSPVEADILRQAFFTRMEDRLAQDLAAISGIYVIRSTEVITTYPVSPLYDPYGDKVGHIPFTPLFFAALGTLIARKIYVLLSTPYKVIVVDCDQTLWQGVCGEDGALGVVIDRPRMQLQEFLVAQQAAGMLLCLCSKNNEQDVLDVFARHPDMRLKREHLVAWRINWQAKSQNLRSLSEELQLSLESFIFIDDNPLECAEVQASCREVLIFPLPQDLGRLAHLLRHFWAFDHLRVTAEDKKRTVLYEQQLQRQAFQKESSTLKDFLEGLKLHVQIAPLEEAQLNRVTQLTQRTNQFNCSTIRRTESEIHQFCRADKGRGGECLVVEVSDRFGDYGLVGVILFTVGPGELEVDTFLLSCRSLGRGVEHQMLAKLGEIAHERGVSRVLIPFIPTSQNTPAREFLESIEAASQQFHSDRWSFNFATKTLIGLIYTPPAEKTEDPGGVLSKKSADLVATTNVSTPRTTTEAKSIPLLRIATELSTAEQVLQAVAAQRRRHPSGQQPVSTPLTRIEEQLVEIWAEVLKLDRVGIHDDFFALGGTSLHATQVASRLQTNLQVEIPLRYFFEAPTAAQLAEIVTQLKVQGTTSRNEEAKSDSRAPILAVQASRSSRPFFFLHGQWTGDALYIWQLARYLGPDQPFYLLEPYKFDGLAIPPPFEAVAAAHLEALLSVQPEGPYLLGGWCNGGLMAYEMARQLHMQGQRVDLLVLMDPDPPAKSWKWERRIIIGLGNLLRRRQEKQVDWFLSYRYLRLSFHYWRLNKLKHMRTTKKGGPVIERSAMDAKSSQLNEVIPRSEVIRQDWLSMYDWVAAGYRPLSYPGKITFFWTDEEPFRRERWLKLMESKIEANETESHIIPGNHITSRTQYLHALAEQLCICINKA